MTSENNSATRNTRATARRSQYRGVSSVAIATAAVLGVSACADSATDEGDVSLRMTWWGADLRYQMTTDAIAICEDETGVTVEAEYTDWDNYWDQLATQTAGGNAPDIMQMDDTYLREYADRGILLDLDAVDTSAMDEDSIANGQTEDGQVGITIGINAMAFLANPEAFEAVGMDIPDDTTWTWDDYADLIAEFSEISDDGQFGDVGPVQPGDFQVWLRQNGTHLTTDEGTIGFTEADLEEYFEFQLELMDRGGFPNASLMIEDLSAASGESMFETGDQALARWWSNAMVGVSDQAGVDMIPLRYPSAQGSAEENGLWFKSSMLWSGHSGTSHPEETQAFIDCLANNPEAGDALGMERGLPANQEVRASVSEQLSGQEAVVVEFMESIEPDIAAQESEPVPPLGASALQDILVRFSEEVYFERMSPAEAAERVVTEATGHLGE